MAELIKTQLYLKVGLPASERITRNTTVEYTEGFREEFTKAIVNNDLITLISNHDSLYNANSISLVAWALTQEARRIMGNDNFKGFILPVATSLTTGHQDYSTGRLFEAVESRLNKNFLFTTPHTRKKDQQQFNMQSNKRTYMENLIDAVNNGYGIAMFPEGTMEGGREDETGARKGMMEFEADALPVILKIATKKERNVAFIPIGTSGGVEIFDPTKKAASLKAWLAASYLWTPKLVKVRVGLPVSSEELRHLAEQRSEEGAKRLINSSLGQKIAELLPDNQRGVFRNGLKP
jgi:hypothetical protein